MLYGFYVDEVFINFYIELLFVVVFIVYMGVWYERLLNK